MGRRIKKRAKRAPFRVEGGIPYLEFAREMKSIGLATYLTVEQHVGHLGITDEIDETLDAIGAMPIGVRLLHVVGAVQPHLDQSPVGAKHIIALGAVATWALNAIGDIALESGCNGDPNAVASFSRYLAEREGLDTHPMNIIEEE